MKLLNAHFQNFRLLRDLSIDFSADPRKRLTVIRAENETGKTTMLMALQWALYGDDALPNKGEGYRIHPIDWDTASAAQVPISVRVEFEVTTTIPSPSGGSRHSQKRYRLIRSATEMITGASWRRGRSTAQLFLIGESGDTPLAEPDAIIREHLPPELREVFFTDGDRALSFIEAGLSTTTKRDRVQRAIRALLGLSVIESAQKHVKDASSDINRKARAMTGRADLQKLAADVEETEKAIADLEEDFKEAKEKFENLDEKLNDLDKRIAAALQKGDQEALAKDLQGCKRRIKDLDVQLEALDKAHSTLFKGANLARDLLFPTLESAMSIIDGLRQQGRIPNTTIPVLRDRLEIGTCICGLTLDPKDPEGAARRAHIESLIEQNKKEDEVQMLLTEFYFRSKSFVYDQSRESMPWVQMYSDYFAQRTAVDKQRETEGIRMRAIETRIEALGKSDIAELRQTQQLYRQQRDDANRKQAVLQTQLADRRRCLEDLTKKRDALLKEESKGQLIAGQLDAVQDLLLVLQRSYERLSNEELRKVSDSMNAMFLQMIGADPEQNAIIRKAEISADNDILVYGTEGRQLNPDQDLNGASRRALTLSFILALTKVSEVEAPNIIDTPLGMMAGYVKREVLRTAIQESSQLILFLTSSELRDCEDILDQRAGVVITLSNPAHYPRMLVNRPTSSIVQILRCDCNHRERCQICDRRLDAVPADSPAEATYV
jgi:DNA sulfur modification protein DndD